MNTLNSFWTIWIRYKLQSYLVFLTMFLLLKCVACWRVAFTWCSARRTVSWPVTWSPSASRSACRCCWRSPTEAQTRSGGVISSRTCSRLAGTWAGRSGTWSTSWTGRRSRSCTTTKKVTQSVFTPAHGGSVEKFNENRLDLSQKLSFFHVIGFFSRTTIVQISVFNSKERGGG